MKRYFHNMLGMDISSPNSSSTPSLEHFENFVERNPEAKNIVVSDGPQIVSADRQDVEAAAKTKDAFRMALKAKYPDQEGLVDQAWDKMATSEKSWDAHTISQVISQAAENADNSTWKDIEEKKSNEVGGASEQLAAIGKAFDEYAQAIVESIPPAEQESLRQQLMAGGLATGAIGLAASTPTANAALANLIAAISSSLPHAAALPMMGSAGPVALAAGSTAATTTLPAAHLAAAAALMGSAGPAAVAGASAASLHATIVAAAPAIATFIVAGAIAHRIFIAARRMSNSAHRIEHEVNNISVAMIAAALQTIPPAQHAMLLGAIIGSIAGQHIVDPGIMEQAFHNIRDAALGVYLFNHPQLAITLGEGLKNLLFSASKEMLYLASGNAGGVAATTTTGGTAAATATTAGSAAATATVTHSVSASIFPHSITAIIGKAVVVATATIAAHPVVVTTLLVGGACAVAYNVATSSSSAAVRIQ